MTVGKDPGRAAYEARFAHARPRDVEPWDSLTPEVRAIWARVEAACVASIKAELDEAREEAELVRDDSGDQMRMLDAIASKLGLAHDEGLEDAGPFLAKIDRLRIAFHDAIRRPLGVTPDSGAEFYDPRMADEAEERRAAQASPKAASTAWPAGCIKPGSCSRHRGCMYARSVEQCRHFGQDLTQAVEAATRDREWAAAERQKGSQP